MTYINQTDLDNRLPLIQQWIGTFGEKVVTEFSYGQTCAKIHLKQLAIVEILYTILSEYTPITAETLPVDNTNCISEVQAQKLFDSISTITKIAFNPINATYIN